MELYTMNFKNKLKKFSSERYSSLSLEDTQLDSYIERIASTWVVRERGSRRARVLIKKWQPEI